MNLNEYQEKAVSTAIYPSEMVIVYPALGLNGEAGEVAEKVKKMIRDNNGILSDEIRESIIKELGDVLWYVANTANDINASLDEIANVNIEKLNKRKQENKLKGSGDDR